MDCHVLAHAASRKIEFCAAARQYGVNFTFLTNAWPPVSDADFEGAGLGGSEAAQVLLCRVLASRGHRVTVFSQTYKPGISNGVEYLNLAQLDVAANHEVVILVKAMLPGFRALKARRKLFWSTDIRPSPLESDVVPYADRLLLMSEFHRRWILEQYPTIDSGMLEVMHLGVYAPDYLDEHWDRIPTKANARLIYCSMPDRGLEHLARLFPRILAHVPSAELIVTGDYSLYRQPAGSEVYARLFSRRPGIQFLGKVSRAQLVALQRSAKVLAYPCTFPEGFCISAAECMAAGAVPVTTEAFALPTTVGDAGILIPGSPGECGYDDAFVAGVTRLLTDPIWYCELAVRGRQRVATRFTWEHVADRFEAVAA